MILILGGTSDGVTLAKAIGNMGELLFSVATPMGEAAAAELKGFSRILTGRRDEVQLLSLLREEQVKLVVDCTHPYAVLVSENGKAAAEKAGIPYYRYERPAIRPGEAGATLLWFDDYKGAAEYLNGEAGNIFSTLGSKNMGDFIGPIEKKERLTARVLPDCGSIEGLLNAGLDYSQIIAMKGPFSLEMNRLMMKERETRFLVTKDSGRAGGFEEKLLAAAELGVTVIGIRRKGEAVGESESLSGTKPEKDRFDDMEELIAAVKGFIGQDLTENSRIG